MKKKRLEAIASLVNKDAFTLDIGTDHAYLQIYLINNNNTNKVISSDISKNVLSQSINNLKKYNLDDKVLLVQSDGFNNIKDNVDIAVIAGMGAHTIINIINNAKKLPDKIIIQSNNNVDKIRKYMQGINYKIIKEMVVYENNKYYIIIKYEKGKDNLTKEEIEFGKNYNKEYLQYLLKKYQENVLNNKEYEKNILQLEHFIEKIQD